MDETATAKTAAAAWRTIDRLMTAVEGEGWAAGKGEADLCQVAEGPEQGRLIWRVGRRDFAVEDEQVVETTLVDGLPTRRRVIGGEGVVRDDRIIHPCLN
jgi:hypothetical protein